MLAACVRRSRDRTTLSRRDGRSCSSSPSADPSGQLAEQVAMSVRVDLAAEHFLGSGDGDLRDLAAQLLARAIDLDPDLGAARLDLGFARGFAVGLALLDDARRATVSL